jgi:hypothetical protein
LTPSEGVAPGFPGIETILLKTYTDLHFPATARGPKSRAAGFIFSEGEKCLHDARPKK